MGSVYLAERADELFSQKVAIKVLAAHLSGNDFEKRFRVERQLLAQMHHPNIVQLLDGGVTESGEAFLVTEYVDGAPIDRFCDHRRLNVVQRIELCLQVCAAVEHAHQNLVVHRDLKPSNILVTLEQAIVKLLDFGTAKLLKSAEAATVTEVMLLTPQYASPEQLRKDPITTRADIYSLGIILFELLSGQRPFAGTGEVMHELARAYEYSKLKTLGTDITEEIAGRRAASTRELSRALSGDLRVICAKALEHEPARRYATVREFMDDLEAYLGSRPVKARPATLLYRAGKFIHRERIAVAAGVLAVAAISGGIVGTLREKQLAERRFEDVRRLARYQIFDLYDQLQDVQGTTRLRAGMSAVALRYLNALAAEATQDESLAVEIAKGYLRVGDVEGNFAMQSLGNWRDALETYQKGLKVLGQFQGLPARQARAWLQYSSLNARLTLEPAKDGANQIAPIVYDYEALVREAPRDAENHLRLGKVYQAVARALPSGQFGDKSAEWVDKAKAAFEKGLEREPKSNKLLAAMASLAGERAGWLVQTRPQEALRWIAEAEMWYLQLPEPMRRKISTQRDRASSLVMRATALFSSGRKEEGHAEMLKALTLFEDLARDPDNLAAKMDLFSTIHNLALMEDGEGNAAAFLKLSERMLTLIEDILARSRSARSESYFESALYNLSYAYSQANDPRATATLKRTFAVLEAKVKANPKEVSSRVLLSDLILNLAHPGFDKAEVALDYTRQLTEIAPGELNSWELLAAAHLKLKAYPEAVQALEKGIALIPAPKPGEPPSNVYQNLTERLGRYREKLATAARQ